MTKLEAWKKFNEAVPGLEATEYTLEKSSHGKAFSFAWDAAVEAEREACAKICSEIEMDGWDLWNRTADPEARGISTGASDCYNLIQARGDK